MELIFCFLYLALFFLSIFKKDTRFYILPIFIFCYPNNANYINFGMGFGLDDIFIISHLLIASFDFKYNNYLSNFKDIKKWKSINLMILLIYIVSNTLGFLVDYFQNFIFLDFFRTTLLFSYTYFICLIYIQNCRSNDDIKAAKLGLIVATVYQAVIAYLVFYFPMAYSYFFDSNELLLGGDIAYRAVGSLKGPWELGGFLAIGFILILSELFTKKTDKNIQLIVMAFSLMIILFAIVLSTSRASWLFVAGALLVFTIQNPAKILFYSVPIIILGFLLFNQQIDQIIGILFSRVEHTTSNSSGRLDNSSMERFIIWERLGKNFNIFYSMIGYGWQNFIKTFGTTPHNGYLSAFISSGVIGLIVYYKFFKKIYNKQSEKFTNKIDFGIIPIFAGLSLYSITSDTLFTAAVFKVLTIIGTLVVLNYNFAHKYK